MIMPEPETYQQINFLMAVKKFDEYTYSSRMLEGKKFSKKAKVSFPENKSGDLFDELNPKFSIYEDKRKRDLVNEEKMSNSEDLYNESTMELEGKSKKAMRRKRLRKKRIKFREKLKVGNGLQRKEFREEKDGGNVQ
jgi:hypothetical protein